MCTSKLKDNIIENETMWCSLNIHSYFSANDKILNAYWTVSKAKHFLHFEIAWKEFYPVFVAVCFTAGDIHPL